MCPWMGTQPDMDLQATALTAAVPGRLAVFMPEHVGIFAMRDSTPLRRAVPVFCGALVLGALALRLLPPAVLRRAWWLPSPRRAAIAAGALVVGVIVLQLPMPFDIQVGDTLSAVAGCNKSKTACRDTFSNLDNFRGFSFVPGPDRALAIGSTQ